jgi:hypothetical protein
MAFIVVLLHLSFKINFYPKKLWLIPFIFPGQTSDVLL